MGRASFLIAFILLGLLLAMTVVAQAVGLAERSDVLGYVSSNNIYITDVNLQITLSTGIAHAALGGGVWSPDLSYVAFVDTRRNIIMTLDTASGELRALTSTESQALVPQWSPDGSRLAYLSDADGDMEIYVMEMATGDVQQITDNDIPDGFFLWLPDSHRIAYAAFDDRNIRVLVYDLNTQTNHALTEFIAPNQLPAWSPDGQRFVYTVWVEGGSEIRLTDASTNETRLLFDFPSQTGVRLQWSADAQYVTFQLNGEIYILNAQTGERIGIDRGSARIEYFPVWSPAGDRLAFVSDRDGNHDIYILDVVSGETQSISNNNRFNINPGWWR